MTRIRPRSRTAGGCDPIVVVDRRVVNDTSTVDPDVTAGSRDVVCVLTRWAGLIARDVRSHCSWARRWTGRHTLVRWQSQSAAGTGRP